jgi:hypothetical protein
MPNSTTIPPNEQLTNISTDIPDNESVTFDLEAFDELIRSQGVKLIHYRAMRCPVGLTNNDMYDSRRPHDDHSGCSNGFLYKSAGMITTAFTGNSARQQQMDMGTVDQAQVTVTFPRFYDDKRHTFSCVPFDRFYLSESSIDIVNWQLIEAHATGRERLSFPITVIEHVFDSSGHEFEPDDYQVDQNGQMVWLKNRPLSGTVCSVRYRYRPYWYCKQLIHEIRVTQAEHRFTGVRAIQRMQMQAVLQREVFFENEDKDPNAVNPNSLRQVKGPRDGSFGPR